MKKIFVWSLAAAALLTSVSCSNQEDQVSPEMDQTNLSIKLKGTQTAGARMVTDPGLDAENKINNVAVLVFKGGNKVGKDDNGDITTYFFEDMTKPFSCTKLPVGQVEVVVVANYPPALKTQLTAITTRAQLNVLASASLDLASQYNADGSAIGATGLTMTGHKDATLAKGNNPVTVEVSRAVAKVKLGTLTITPATGQAPMTVKRVSMQIVPNRSLLGLNDYVAPAPMTYLGGITGQGTTVSPLLVGNASATGLNPFFYVFPNGAANATLISIEGTIQVGGATVTKYYSCVVKDPAGTGLNIKANHSYTFDMTIKNTGEGTPDPNTPGDAAAVEVTVTPQPWVVVPNIPLNY